MKTNNNEEVINFANDLGYGSIKGVINGTQIKVPSAVVPETDNDVFDPVTFSDKLQERNYMNDFLDHLDVSIQSSSVKSSQRMFVGNSAINSHLQPLQTFDVSDMDGKAGTDLAIIFTLSTIAGKAVQDYYDTHKKLPKREINANVNMVTALPILEGNKNQTKSYYQKRYTSCDHTVAIRNFKDTINVKIHFNTVLVSLEDVMAIFAIRHANPRKPLAINVRKDFYADYPERAKRYKPSAEYLLHAPNILGIDIGEGTTDFAIFNTNKGSNRIVPNKQASNSIKYGFGTILNQAVQDLNSNHVAVSSRADLKSLLNQPDSMFGNERKRTAQKAVAQQAPRLESAIIDGMSQTMKNSDATVDMIYVFGGGSIPMKKFLLKPLQHKTRSFTGGFDIPVIFINKDYAQYVNQIGLQMALNSIISD